MRPDAHKQKASRKYKVKQNAAAGGMTGKDPARTVAGAKVGHPRTHAPPTIPKEAVPVVTPAIVDGGDGDRYKELSDDEDADRGLDIAVLRMRLEERGGVDEDVGGAMAYVDHDQVGQDRAAARALEELMAVDVAFVGTALQSIPLPQRLGVDRCFFEGNHLEELDSAAVQSRERFRKKTCSSEASKRVESPTRASNDDDSTVQDTEVFHPSAIVLPTPRTSSQDDDSGEDEDDLELDDLLDAIG